MSLMVKILHKAATFIMYVALFLAVFYAASALIKHQDNVVVTDYDIYSDKIHNPFKAVVIADMHNKNYGDNKQLIEIINSQKPDVIFMVGDMFSTAKGLEDHRSFFEALTEIAPVYYSFGNKELAVLENYNVKSVLEETGVNYIDDSVRKIKIKGNKIFVCGLSSYCMTRRNTRDFYISLLERHTYSDDFRLLLCHYPEYYPWIFEKLDFYKYDLMLAGHTHGGGINFPLLGRFCAPNQGLFPQYVYGYYPDLVSGPMIISGGLGNPDEFFRINNPPEITVVNFKSAV